MTILWFALIFMLNFLCLRDTGDSAHRLLKNDEHMHARYYFVVIVFLFIHYLICVQRRINTVVGIDMATQTDASRTPEMANYERAIGELKYRHQMTRVIGELKHRHQMTRVIGELKRRHQVTTWARFVSRTLARFDEIANLKNKVQVLERWLEKSWTREEVLREKIGQSWTREEVLREKISQCAASGALVLVHSLNSLNASAFARKSDADELDLDLPVLRTRSAPV